ncbi:MAG: hypothetical protein K9K64_05385 [Desulfohalobiaceae bacterium]|nr:hypothetical protein [Desulfohalobiaceae bacterium]
MRFWMRPALAVLLLAALFSCASRPPSQDTAAADYGSYPADYQNVVEKFYAGFISDSCSTRFQWLEPPYPGHIFYSCGKIKYGYLVKTAITITDHVQDDQKQIRRVFLIYNDRVVDRMQL